MLSIHFKIQLSFIVPTMQQEPQEELTEMSHLHLHKTNTLKSHHSAQGEVGLGKGGRCWDRGCRRSSWKNSWLHTGDSPWVGASPSGHHLAPPRTLCRDSADEDGRSHCNTTDLEVYYVSLAPDSEA